ncbi:hypothetical protein SDC9_43870 [bioreactor metagenome]|uniref:NB-ARC domain-containing protein n=1 Tax=bioreactor metagenome TaxID=1076179 RepID=A0A644W266_9ZZZZ
MERISFGSQLRALRNSAEYYENGYNHLSQQIFGELVSEYFKDADFTRDTVSKWENGETIIRVEERTKLCAIISVLYRYKSIHSRQESDAFLQMGRYDSLDENEAKMINPEWVNDPALKTDFGENHFSNLPDFPSLWFGRNDDLQNVKNLLKGLNQGNRPIRVMTIHGRAGVGKSALAAKLAHDPELKSQYSDAVLWITLGENANILESLACWGKMLGDQEFQQARTVHEAQSRLSTLLKNKHALLIIDDVWRNEDINFFNVGGPGCITLVTTRDENLAAGLATNSDYVYSLKPLDEENAIRLLNELAPQKATQYPDQCKQLTNVLEGLPLALQIAGRMLRHEIKTGPDILEFIKEINQKSAELEKADPDDRSELIQFTSPTIAAMLEKCVELLNVRTRKGFTFLGSFAAKPYSFDANGLKIAWRTDNPGPTIRALVDHGLVESQPDGNRYQMHLLLALLANNLLSEYEAKKKGLTINTSETIDIPEGKIIVFKSRDPIEGKHTTINHKLHINNPKPGSEITIFDLTNDHKN